MRELIIGENDGGQRLDRFLSKAVPRLPASLLQKSIRLKRIKRNGKRTERDVKLEPGDVLQLYLNDEWFEPPRQPDDPLPAYRQIRAPKLQILYEDDQLLLVHKQPGLSVQPDEHETVHTLINYIKAYLYESGAWNPAAEQSFTPALCHRIDRNTGGIVIAAKTAAALRVMNQKIRDRELDKFYLCVVYGTPAPKEGLLSGFLLKDAAKNKVTVYDRPRKGALSAQTRYRVLESRDGLSLVECQLITGRTHQIRAQFANSGHPLLGDGKYGSEMENRKRRQKKQALFACRLEFHFTTPAGPLEPLKHAVFRAEPDAFLQQYFPKPRGEA